MSKVFSLADLVVHEIGVREDLTSYERVKNHFVMAKNGLFKIKSTGAVLIKECIAPITGTAKVPMLEEITEGVEYLLPKIPFKWYINILDFFKYVYEKDKTEASCLIYYNQNEEAEDVRELIPEDLQYLADKGLETDGRWIIYAPQQKNHSTLTDFKGDPLDEWFKHNTLSVIECHSHHTMNAFWSGTDNANQKENMYYGVFGHINTEDKFLLKKIGANQKVYDNLDVTEIFEFPKVSVTIENAESYGDIFPEPEKVYTYKGAFQRLDEFPMKWYEECHRVNYSRNVVGEFGTSEMYSEEEYDGFDNVSLTNPYKKNLPTARRHLGFGSFAEKEETRNQLPNDFYKETAQYLKEDVDEDEENEFFVPQKIVDNEKDLPSTLDIEDSTSFLASNGTTIQVTNAEDLVKEFNEDMSGTSLENVAKISDLPKN